MFPPPVLPLSNVNRKLPPEILLAIFRFVIPTPKSHTTTPFLLSTVCKHWKAIVYSTPSLWTSIYLDVPRPREEKAKSTYAMAKRWLAMTGSTESTLPIDIHLDIEDSFRRSYEQVSGYEFAIFNIMGPFLPYACRWRSLHVPLCMETKIVFDLVGIGSEFSDPKAVISSLASLTLYGVIGGWPDLSAVSSRRTLTLVQFKYEFYAHSLSTLMVNYANLTRIVCCVPVLVHCIETVIAQCTSAVDIAFDNVFIEVIDADEPWGQHHRYVPFDLVEHNEIDLPHLRNLVISLQDTHDYPSGEATDTLVPLFSKLKAPSLCTLILEQQFKCLISCSQLQLFLQTSHCALTKLTLNGLALTTAFDSLISLLATLTTVEDLCVYLSPDQPETKLLWNALIDSSEFLPQVKLFQYTGPFGEISDEDLAGLLRYRWGPSDTAARLERAILDRLVTETEWDCMSLPEEDEIENNVSIQKIFELTDEGMDIFISGHWEVCDIFKCVDEKEIDTYRHNNEYASHGCGYVARGFDYYWEL